MGYEISKKFAKSSFFFIFDVKYREKKIKKWYEIPGICRAWKPEKVTNWKRNRKQSGNKKTGKRINTFPCF